MVEFTTRAQNTWYYCPNIHCKTLFCSVYVKFHLGISSFRRNRSIDFRRYPRASHSSQSALRKGMRYCIFSSYVRRSRGSFLLRLGRKRRRKNYVLWVNCVWILINGYTSERFLSPTKESVIYFMMFWFPPWRREWFIMMIGCSKANSTVWKFGTK